MVDRNSKIKTIQALLSKTMENGCSEAEMLSALRMARALQDTYEISDDELQLSREEKATLHAESGAETMDPHRIKWQLCHGVSSYCNVEIYRVSKKPGLTFVGFKSDTEYARWLLDHLADQVHNSLFEYLLDHDCLAPKERKGAILDFIDAYAARIEATMIAACEQSKKARTTSGKELVIVKDHAIKDFLKANDIRLQCEGGGRSRASFSASARAAGDSAGHGATFGRPVSGAGATLRLGKN
jgi:hypothetical protein